MGLSKPVAGGKNSLSQLSLSKADTSKFYTAQGYYDLTDGTTRNLLSISVSTNKMIFFHGYTIGVNAGAVSYLFIEVLVDNVVVISKSVSAMAGADYIIGGEYTRKPVLVNTPIDGDLTIRVRLSGTSSTIVNYGYIYSIIDKE